MVRSRTRLAFVLALASCDPSRADGTADAGRPAPTSAPPPPAPSTETPYDCREKGGHCETGSPKAVCAPIEPSEQCPANPFHAPASYCCVPIDWEPLAIDPQCGFEEAWHAGALPSPIAYEPCPAALAAAWPGCVQIRIDWPAATGAFAGRSIGPAEAAIDSTGGVALALTRYSGAYAYYTIVDRTGTTVAALRSARPDCALVRGEASGLFTFKRPGRTLLLDAAGPPVDGYLHGDWRVLESFADDVERRYVDGVIVYLALPENVVKKRLDGSTVATAPAGAKPNAVLFTNTLLFEPDDPSRPRVEVFKFPPNETTDLLAGRDASSGVADYGTDRKDAVWVEGSGRAVLGAPFTTIDVFTSTYVSDPALIGTSVQKRRLRSETSFGGAPFVVGCGYAAHAFASPTDGRGVRLIRLSDGTSWRFVDVASGGPAPFHFERPLAISCSEFVLQMTRDTTNQVIRIKLADLPPGDPAD